MIQVVLWKWRQLNYRQVFTAEFVNIVSSMMRKVAFPDAEIKVTCITDQADGILEPTRTVPLWNDHAEIVNATGRHLPSCYRRLKLFDHDTQRQLGFESGDWIISIDLDTVVLASITDVLEQVESSGAVFAGWGVPAAYHRTVYNGSFWLFKCGDKLQSLWSTFDPATSPTASIRKGFLGSDQSWVSMHLVPRTNVDVYPIRFPVFASYPREVKRSGTLDRRTRIVFFHGARKPWDREEQRQMPWIQRHWRLQ